MILEVLISMFSVISAVLFIRWIDLKGKESVAACKAWCDADEIFFNWRLRNPGVYIGLSEEGRRLLGRLIDSWDRFLKAHKFIKDDGYSDFLESLYFDLPPKPPKRAIPGGMRGVLNKDTSLIFIF